MRAGRIVEFERAEELFEQPRDPYTQHLIKSVLGLRHPPKWLNA
jgi:ABC-type dipeptide/oligopeptide/nickel transport system ATPase component